MPHKGHKFRRRQSRHLWFEVFVIRRFADFLYPVRPLWTIELRVIYVVEETAMGGGKGVQHLWWKARLVATHIDMVITKEQRAS